MRTNQDLLNVLNTSKARIQDEKVVLSGEMKRGDTTMKVRHLGNREPFYRFKPVFVLSDRGTSEKDLQVVEKGLDDILKSIGMKGIIPVHILGYWNQGNGPHQSVDWYVNQAFDADRSSYDIKGKGQCNIAKMWNDLAKDPVQRTRPHYDVIVLSNNDLFSSDYPGLNFLIGEGPEQGTIISLARYKGDEEAIRAAALHEFGHTFARQHHCGQVKDGKPGECTMKFPNAIPSDLKAQADYRNKTGILFCDKHDLKRYEVLGSDEFFQAFPDLKRLQNAIYSRNPVMLELIDSGKPALMQTEVKFR